MTPSLTLILFVALFWTLPASLAVLTYRRHGSSVARMTESVRRSMEPVLDLAHTEEAKARLEA